jgi:hypothetical protein
MGPLSQTDVWRGWRNNFRSGSGSCNGPGGPEYSLSHSMGCNSPAPSQKPLDQHDYPRPAPGTIAFPDSGAPSSLASPPHRRAVRSRRSIRIKSPEMICDFFCSWVRPHMIDNLLYRWAAGDLPMKFHL